MATRHATLTHSPTTSSANTRNAADADRGPEGRAIPFPGVGVFTPGALMEAGGNQAMVAVQAEWAPGVGRERPERSPGAPRERSSQATPERSPAPAPEQAAPPAAREEDDPILTSLRAAVRSNRLSLAVYGSGHPDSSAFRTAAQLFAGQHGAFGTSGGRIVRGPEAAMGAGTAAEVVQAVTGTIAAIRGRLAEAGPAPEASSGEAAPPGDSGGEAATAESATSPTAVFSTLALFTHGFPDGLRFRERTGRNQPHDLGRGRVSARAFAEQIESSLSGQARVVLYACSAGRQEDEGEDRATSGEGSFADQVRDSLDEGGGQREVWGHTTPGHTSGNPNWRRYRGEQQGEQAGEDPYWGGRGAGEATAPGNLGGDRAIDGIATAPALAPALRRLAHAAGLVRGTQYQAATAMNALFRQVCRANRWDRAERRGRTSQEIARIYFEAWIAQEMPFVARQGAITQGAQHAVRPEILTAFAARFDAQHAWLEQLPEAPSGEATTPE